MGLLKRHLAVDFVFVCLLVWTVLQCNPKWLAFSILLPHPCWYYSCVQPCLFLPVVKLLALYTHEDFLLGNLSRFREKCLGLPSRQVIETNIWTTTVTCLSPGVREVSCPVSMFRRWLKFWLLLRAHRAIQGSHWEWRSWEQEWWLRSQLAHLHNHLATFWWEEVV